MMSRLSCLRYQTKKIKISLQKFENERYILLKPELDKLEQEYNNDKLENIIAQICETWMDTSMELDEMKNKYETVVISLKEIDTENNGLKSQKICYETRLQKLIDESNEQIQEIENEMKEYKDTVKSLKGNTDNLEEQLDAKLNKINELNKKLSQHELKTTEKNEILLKVQYEAETLKSTNTELLEENKNLKMLIDNMAKIIESQKKTTSEISTRHNLDESSMFGNNLDYTQNGNNLTLANTFNFTTSIVETSLQEELDNTMNKQNEKHNTTQHTKNTNLTNPTNNVTSTPEKIQNQKCNKNDEEQQYETFNISPIEHNTSLNTWESKDITLQNDSNQDKDCTVINITEKDNTKTTSEYGNSVNENSPLNNSSETESELSFVSATNEIESIVEKDPNEKSNDETKSLDNNKSQENNEKHDDIEAGDRDDSEDREHMEDSCDYDENTTTVLSGDDKEKTQNIHLKNGRVSCGHGNKATDIPETHIEALANKRDPKETHDKPKIINKSYIEHMDKKGESTFSFTEVETINISSNKNTGKKDIDNDGTSEKENTKRNNETEDEINESTISINSENDSISTIAENRDQQNPNNHQTINNTTLGDNYKQGEQIKTPRSNQKTNEELLPEIQIYVPKKIELSPISTKYVNINEIINKQGPSYDMTFQIKLLELEQIAKEHTKKIAKIENQLKPTKSNTHTETTNKKYCYLLGDSHLRYIRDIMGENKIITEKYKIQTDIIPGGKLQDITKRTPKNMSKDSILIICAGTNDLYTTETVTFEEEIEKLSRLELKRIIIIGIPPQTNITNNRNILRLNTKIKHLCTTYHNMEFINTHTFIKPEHLARDGIHLGRKAKIWLAEKITSMINRNNTQPNQTSEQRNINTPQSYTQHRNRENATYEHRTTNHNGQRNENNEHQKLRTETPWQNGINRTRKNYQDEEIWMNGKLISKMNEGETWINGKLISTEKETKPYWHETNKKDFRWNTQQTSKRK
uniref:Uncharacterized protein n=1 Tax=Cacopsylla melanoneura TaxID=428564 RepID=A0A8D8X9Y4_9HEMI